MKRNGFGFGSLSFSPEGIKVDMFSRQLDIIKVKLIKMVAEEMDLVITD